MVVKTVLSVVMQIAVVSAVISGDGGEYSASLVMKIVVVNAVISGNGEYGAITSDEDSDGERGDER